MRRIVRTQLSRQQCLRRAREFEILAQISQAPDGGVRAWDQARLYRSLALVADRHDTHAIDADGLNPESPAIYLAAMRQSAENISTARLDR